MNIYIKKKDIVLGNKRSVDDIMHQLYSKSTGNRENFLLKIDLPGCILICIFIICTQVSGWTKLCEIELPSSITSLISTIRQELLF